MNLMLEQFRLALVNIKMHLDGKQPNICLIQQEAYDEMFAQAMNLMGQKWETIPPYFEWDGCVVIPAPAKMKLVLITHWPLLQTHNKMAELAGELVPLLVDQKAVEEGKSVDGGDPLTIKSKHDDAGGKSAERRIGRLVREMRKLL
jgi:hypothetical protein